MKKNEINNVILGTIHVEDEYNLVRTIINSYENVRRENIDEIDWDIVNCIINEEQIKDCEIYLMIKKLIFVIIIIFQQLEIIHLNIYLKNH